MDIDTDGATKTAQQNKLSPGKHSSRETQADLMM